MVGTVLYLPRDADRKVLKSQKVTTNQMLAVRSRRSDEEEEKRRRLREVPILRRPAPLAAIEPALIEPPPITRNTSEVPLRPLEPLLPPPVAPAAVLSPSVYTPTTPVPIFNNKGRPIGVEGGGDPLEQQRVLLREQQNYKQPFSKKDFALQTLFSFLGGGLPGAISGAARYGLDPKYRTQVAMGSDIADTERNIQRELIARNQTNDLENDQSLRGYRDAQTRELINRTARPPKIDSKFIERRDGVYEVSVEYPNGRKIGDIPPERQSGGTTHYFERPDGVYGVNAEHPDGFKVSGVPGKPEKEEPDHSFGNSQVEQSMREAETEKNRIWASLKDIPPTITVPGKVYSDGSSDPPETKPNPAYTDLMSRGRALDDDIRRLRTQLKPITRNGSGKKKWSSSRWAAANPNGNVNAAIAAAKKQGLEVVD